MEPQDSPIPHWMMRTNVLLGPEKLNRLRNAHVLVVGLGGIGGICAEMICRSGVGKMTIVDADDVDPTNRNRQIPALSSTEGKLKVDVLGARLKDINPDLNLVTVAEYISGQEWGLLDTWKPDFAVDCIDTLSCKVWFIRACIEKGIPIVCSMGAGGKLDPSKVRVSDISETYNDKLSQYVRKKLHRWGIYGGFKCVWSTEDIDKGRVLSTPNDPRKASVIGTISYMPAIFGCTVASVVLRDLFDPPKLSKKKAKQQRKLKDWRGKEVQLKKERAPLIKGYPDNIKKKLEEQQKEEKKSDEKNEEKKSEEKEKEVEKTEEKKEEKKSEEKVEQTDKKE